MLWRCEIWWLLGQAGPLQRTENFTPWTLTPVMPSLVQLKLEAHWVMNDLTLLQHQGWLVGRTENGRQPKPQCKHHSPEVSAHASFDPRLNGTWVCCTLSIWQRNITWHSSSDSNVFLPTFCFLHYTPDWSMPCADPRNRSTTVLILAEEKCYHSVFFAGVPKHSEAQEMKLKTTFS